jgi:lactate dehydrogenase-like 2-hydroxyacid dehydrogenase
VPPPSDVPRRGPTGRSAELRARGVTVTKSAGANAAVVAQTALGGVLALSRRFPQSLHAQHGLRSLAFIQAVLHSHSKNGAWITLG